MRLRKRVQMGKLGVNLTTQLRYECSKQKIW